METLKLTDTSELAKGQVIGITTIKLKWWHKYNFTTFIAKNIFKIKPEYNNKSFFVSKIIDSQTIGVVENECLGDYCEKPCNNGNSCENNKKAKP